MTLNQSRFPGPGGDSRAMALLGAIAVVAMASRSRQQEIAVLRCAGATIGGVCAQVVIEAALYVGTA